MSTNYYAVKHEDDPHYRGVFLGKTAGGWVPQLKWHTYHYCDCPCPNHTHLYRNWDELTDYLSRPEITIKDEYDQTYDLEDFIVMMRTKKEHNDREPAGDRVWEIDGWHFLKGHWS